MPDWWFDREIAIEYHRDIPTVADQCGRSWTAEEYYRELVIRRIISKYKDNPLGLD